MKKIILSTLFSFYIAALCAQVYNNEWIDYSKTYYKFKVGSKGLWRINQSTLASAGLGNANAEDFVLWRNGETVPIYTSVPTGPIPVNGYIEFYGVQNDGKPDKPLYRKPEYQVMDKYSLETDTSTYFLTTRTGFDNNRYTLDVNNIAGNTRSPEPYFMYTTGRYFNQKINAGNAAIIGTESVNSSAYDIGEGFSSADILTGTTNFVNGGMYTEPSGPDASFSYAAFGNANNSRTLRISLNSTPYVAQVINYFDAVTGRVDNIPASLFSSNSVNCTVQNDASIANDRIVMMYYELTYPRKFIFDGLTLFEFTLPAKADTTFLQIANFAYYSSQPALFDLTNKRLMFGDITDPSGAVRVVLPPSATERKMALSCRQPGVFPTVNELTPINFTDYSNAANQGDYLIISNPILYNDGSGNNYVDQYRQYRSSSVGGGYNAKIYDIGQLIDQFAFGIKNHPLSIKNFLRYARDNFSQKPRFCFLMGKGVAYVDARLAERFAKTPRINLIPTFGWPASDNMLASETSKNPLPETPIGRLSVVYPGEIKSYLDKVKEYEALLASNSCAVADKAWMKQVMHVIGAEDAIGNLIDYYMSSPYTDTIQSTNYGGFVNRFRKTSDIAIQQISNDEVPKLFKDGLSLVTYFGHSSPNTLQFSLDDPKDLKNAGKYPFFIANGCNAGNNFLWDTLRLAENLTLSEKNIVTPNAGTIGFLASTHLGVVNFLHFYTQEFYNQLSKKAYGQPYGEMIKNTIDYIMQTYTEDDFYNRQNAEQINLNGDPAVHAYSFSKPDYAIEPALVNISPQFISIAETDFKVTVKIMNIGKGATDSIRLIVKRQYPVDGHEEEIYNQKIPAVQFADSVQIQVPILPLRDKGNNKFTFTIDADNTTDELCELNNTVTKDVFIYENELRPLYPANYAIINKQNITFSASTANALQPTQQYFMELDTTAKFNSPLKITANANSTGGLISFNPSITFTDGTVYYWRTGVGNQSSGDILWNNASFVYLPNSSEGFNQSHYYQFKNDDFININLDSNSRQLQYRVSNRNLKIRTGVVPIFTFDRMDVSLDFNPIDNYACNSNAFQFYILDGETLKAWKNTGGLYNSLPICQRPYRSFFEFSYTNTAGRVNAMNFMDMVPDSNYIVILNIGRSTGTQYTLGNLMSDTATLGSNNSIYHTFKKYGLDLIDSFRSNRPMIFVFKKNDFSFPAQQYFANTTDWLVKDFDLPGLIYSGTVESPWFGPVKKWNELHWDGQNLEPEPDAVSIELIGKTPAGDAVSLAVVSPSKDTSISFIDAQQYPYVKLRMSNTDTLHTTPNQLKYWRLNAETLPEGAIAPNITYEFKEMIEQGENVHFKVAFKNISDKTFEDSLQVKCIITDRNNVPHTITIPKLKPLDPGELAIVEFTIDSKDYFGSNSLYFGINPDGQVPEKYLFNNFLYKDFSVNEDKYNPLLDVTFDGIHILNKDVVSAKPHIQIKLKDNSQYLLLKDTSLLKIQVRYPNGSVKDVAFNSSLVQFIPATSGSDNNAMVNFFPAFTEDGQYELIVSGRDANGNKAGQAAYRVIFMVINKPMISNMLNYPNPFTTSTAFVFTLTGSEVPQNIRIQILTITGKVVREITKAELGPIHIGRNITEFKWDGTDQYGQKLANGVYLYRVITNLNGKSLDKYKSGDDNTDKYFNNGYGKMYLMR